MMMESYIPVYDYISTNTTSHTDYTDYTTQTVNKYRFLLGFLESDPRRRGEARGGIAGVGDWVIGAVQDRTTSIPTGRQVIPKSLQSR